MQNTQTFRTVGLPVVALVAAISLVGFSAGQISAISDPLAGHTIETTGDLVVEPTALPTAIAGLGALSLPPQ